MKVITLSLFVTIKVVLDHIEHKNLQNGNFSNDKHLQGKHKGKFRKRAGNYRIIYLKEDNFLVIAVIRVAHRKEAY